MIPKIITEQLSALRNRERFLEAVWGLARLTALAVEMIIVACLVDYVVDRFGTTPPSLRMAMWIVMLGVLIVAAILFFQPLLARLDDDELTLWVEGKTPVLGHRLITAVQLNREDAQTAGMSRELVGVVTAEAEQQVQRVPFTRAADHTRLKRSAMVAGPALLVGLGALLAFWPVSYVLLGRMFFSGEDIDRRVAVENATKEVWAVGDTVTITVKATGLRPGEEGYLLVRQGLSFSKYDLHREDVKGTDGSQAIFTAPMPDDRYHSNFEFNAFIGDGRMKNWGQIVFRQRPVVQGDPQAWRILPSYCGTWGKSRNRFEQEQSHGDVKSIADSSVKVRVTMATPVETVRVQLLGPEKIKTAPVNPQPDVEPEPEAPSPIVEKRVVAMHQINPDANPENKGSGYKVDDELTVQGGKGSAVTLVVTSVESGGKIGEARATNTGEYQEWPENPVKVEGGQGTAQLSI